MRKLWETCACVLAHEIVYSACVVALFYMRGGGLLADVKQLFPLFFPKY